MPEGHTIHRIARQHNRLFAGRRVRVSSPQGRFAQGAARLSGRVLEQAEATGKHLFYRFDGEDWLHIHLGLFGRVADGAQPAPVPRGALRLRMENDEAWSDLRGPTACELLTTTEKQAVQARLGPDPLRRGADPQRAWARLSRSRVPLGAALMDQSVVAGVGNVYRSEVLFRHRLDPFRPAVQLAPDAWRALWTDLRTLMRAGLRTGRIVTTLPADRDRRSGSPSREDSFYVYRRTGLPCRVCGADVATAPMAGRKLYWCPNCQRG